jgi:transposase
LRQILKQYKEQSGVESSFKFIKSNAFELDSFYLKTPSRIGALMMVMTLCLMVYNFAQYHMRKCMEENGDVLPNQVGKPVKNPTMKWIAELMNIIAVVTIKTEFGIQRIVTNVKKVHRRIIAYFGQHALQIYGLPLDLKQVEIDYSNYKNLLHWCEM